MEGVYQDNVGVLKIYPRCDPNKERRSSRKEVCIFTESFSRNVGDDCPLSLFNPLT